MPPSVRFTVIGTTVTAMSQAALMSSVPSIVESPVAPGAGTISGPAKSPNTTSAKGEIVSVTLNGEW